jgi:D-amino-acid dehydrogenase
MGCRPTLPDYLPAIGRSRRASNLFYAFGHQHLGLTLAPITAELVEALIGGRIPPVEVAPFDAERFERQPVQMSGSDIV